MVPQGTEQALHRCLQGPNSSGKGRHGHGTLRRKVLPMQLDVLDLV
jgi:hypothetical protein